MRIQKLFEGIKIFQPELHIDHRGWFTESWSVNIKELADVTFVQDNHVFSYKKGTLRGLHLQVPPYSQAKLVRCTSGSLLDVVVDLRPDSDTYCMWQSFYLSATNRKSLYIPRGFAHGYITLEDKTEVQYKVDQIYNSQSERQIKWDDSALGIEWLIDNPIISDRDLNADDLLTIKKEIEQGISWLF